MESLAQSKVEAHVQDTATTVQKSSQEVNNLQSELEEMRVKVRFLYSWISFIFDYVCVPHLLKLERKLVKAA